MTEVTFGKGSYHLQMEMVAWCRQQFGDGGVYGTRNGLERWGMDSAYGYTSFYFQNEGDATLFALRWA